MHPGEKSLVIELFMKTPKVLTFGELLWRFSPAADQGFTHLGSLQMFTGGAEANVAVSLANWGVPAAYLTRLPDNELAATAVQVLQQYGVQTDKIYYGGDRMGYYFLAHKNGLSSGQVIYDRKYSAFSQLQPGMIDWENVLRDISWFHWSAISPALNEQVAAVCLEAVQAARKKNITISTDLNYRNRLWDYGRQPHEIMPELAGYCDVIMGNIWAAEKMLQIPLQLPTGNPGKKQLEEAALSTSENICKTFGQCKKAAMTFRFSNHPLHNHFYGTYYDGQELFISKDHETRELTDRIGGGDAFMAGLIYALLNDYAAREIIDFAAAASFKKLFVKGDFNLVTIDEVRKEMQ